MIKKATLLTAFSVHGLFRWAQDTSPDTLVVTAQPFSAAAQRGSGARYHRDASGILNAGNRPP
ncbi:vitamin B12 receptor protein [Salmonella enterica subsp. enterica]|nr:vitamin B12 receptor protein [Salmonella enterica subsp. enterica]